MARISEYQQSNQIPDPSQAVLPRAHAAPVAQPADLSGFVAAIGTAADAYQRSQQENGKAWSAEQTSKVRLDWTQEFINRQQNAEPGAPNFTPNFLKDYDEYANKLLETAPDDLSKKFLHQRLQVIRDEIGEKALTFEAKARTDYRVDSYSNGIENARKLMNTDPSQYEPALAEQLALIDNSSVDPVARSKLREKATTSISEAAVWSQIQRSPSAFLQSIGFGADPSTRTRKSSGDLTGETGNKAFDALPFDRRAQMFEQAVRGKTQVDADLDRASEKLRKQMADDAEKTLWGARADGKLNRVMIEQYRPVLPAAAYESFLKALKDPDSAQKSDPGTYRELQRLIANGETKAAADFAFRSHRAGLLSNADLGSEVTRVRQIDRQEGPKSPYERGRAYITTALDPGPLVHDPLGRSRLAEAQDEYEQWYARNPNKEEKDFREQSHELVTRYKLVDMKDSLVGLPQPRSGTLPRNGADPGFAAALVNAGKSLERRYSAGSMDEATYQEEKALLNRWRKAAGK